MTVLIFMKRGATEKFALDIRKEACLRGLGCPRVLVVKEPFFRRVLFWEFAIQAVDFLCLFEREKRHGVDFIQILGGEK